MTTITEIAPRVRRISKYVPPEIKLQFNQFLILDDEPLLFHTGLKKLFPDVRDAVATPVGPSKIRWIGFRAAMHGSTFIGDGQKAIEDLPAAMKELLA